MSGSRARVQQHAAEEPVSQRDYFQVQLDAVDRRLGEQVDAIEKLLQARVDSMQLAIDTWRAALDTRLEGMNEIRGQLATQRADFVTTDRLESLLTLGQSDRRVFTDKMDALEAQLASTAALAREQTQKDLDVLRDRVAQDVRTINTDIRSLRESRSSTVGSSITAREFVSYGIAIVAIIATVLSRLLP